MRTTGFTLIETIVVVALTSLVMGALGSLLVYFYRTNAYVFQHASATLEARRGIDTAMRSVREASYALDGSYPVAEAATSSISFYADADNDTELDLVTYALLNTTLMRTIEFANGSDAEATISSFVANGTSTPIFRYYGVSGTELSSPIALDDIATVKMTLSIELDTNRGPAAFTLSGNATLRNSRL